MSTSIRGAIARRPLSILLSGLAATALLSGCSGEPEAGAHKPGAGALPAVSVIEVQPKEVAVDMTLPGRLSASSVAEVRPQVSGLIAARLFKEGDTVKAGDVLSRIEASRYRAAHSAAEADVEKARAAVEAASSAWQRAKKLADISAVSQQALEDARLALDQAKANLSGAQAALARTKVDLEDTEVRAPISGKIGRAKILTGALVNAGQPDALAVIHALDPIYADLSQSSTEWARLRARIQEGGLKTASNKAVPVTLTTESGQPYGTPGVMDFAESVVEPETGTVTVRTRFANTAGDLLPGMYVSATLQAAVRDSAYLVPHAAIMRRPGGEASVMIVDEKERIAVRTVRIEGSQAGFWVVTEGLTPGDRVVTAGLQKVRPGVQVIAESDVMNVPDVSGKE